MQKNNYFIWADVVRIVAIVLVVLIHTFVISDEDTLPAVSSLFIFVLAKVCVPLFIMLSGALLVSKQESEQIFFQKRLKRVVVPWVTWTILFFLLTGLKNINSPLAAVTQFKQIFVSQFTFLPLLFCLYLLIPTFRIIVRWGKSLQVWYIVGLWFIAVSVLPYLRNSLAFPLSVDNSLVTQTVQFSGYLLLGWLVSRITIRDKRVLLLMASLIIGITWWVTWLMKMYSYTSPWIIVNSVAVFMMLVNGLPKNMPATHQRVIRILSRTSFGVFLIHNAVKNVILPWLPTSTSISLLYNLSHWLVVVVVSFSLILLLYRVKWLRNYVT